MTPQNRLLALREFCQVDSDDGTIFVPSLSLSGGWSDCGGAVRGDHALLVRVFFGHKSGKIRETVPTVVYGGRLHAWGAGCRIIGADDTAEPPFRHA